jgi:hypothetical protein
LLPAPPELAITTRTDSNQPATLGWGRFAWSVTPRVPRSSGRPPASSTTAVIVTVDTVVDCPEDSLGVADCCTTIARVTSSCWSVSGSCARGIGCLWAQPCISALRLGLHAFFSATLS